MPNIQIHTKRVLELGVQLAPIFPRSTPPKLLLPINYMDRKLVQRVTHYCHAIILTQESNTFAFILFAIVVIVRSMKP